jgi:hypothetical protein
MKITKKQLKRIIAEEHRRLRKKNLVLTETIADMDNVEAEVYGSSVDIAQTFIEEMGVLFTEDPQMFQGRSTEAEWQQQVEWAGAELEQEVADAINAAIERVETRLHDGQFSVRA